MSTLVTEEPAAKHVQAVDRLVGRRVRIARVGRGLSQSALGAQLGVTFQQLQKYEKGTNRISASRLHDIARVLGVEVGSLFKDTSDPESLVRVDGAAPSRTDLLIIQRLSELPEGRLKQQLVGLIFMLADKPPPADAD